MQFRIFAYMSDLSQVFEVGDIFTLWLAVALQRVESKSANDSQ
jgi:hypothetical protein